jgi:hypothetical protein
MIRTRLLTFPSLTEEPLGALLPRAIREKGALMNEVLKPELAGGMPDLTSFTQAGSEATRRLCEHGQSIAKTISDWNTDLGHFVSHRATRTSEAMARMAKCQSFPEVLAVQTQWWQDAADDYLKQASKLAELNSRIIGGLLGSVAAR